MRKSKTSYEELFGKIKENLLDDEENEAFSASGFLEKKTSGLIKRWQLKYCILKGSTFQYYSKKDNKHPAATFNFDQLYATLIQKTENVFILSLIGCKRTFVFRAKSEKEYSY